MTERFLYSLAIAPGATVQAFGVDPEQHLDRLTAHSATSVGGNPPLSQVDTAARRGPYGRLASGEATTSGMNAACMARLHTRTAVSLGSS